MCEGFVVLVFNGFCQLTQKNVGVGWTGSLLLHARVRVSSKVLLLPE